ncbi:MAG: hypothetical protein WDW38_007396 [Sanguina aurantia]
MSVFLQVTSSCWAMAKQLLHHRCYSSVTAVPSPCNSRVLLKGDLVVSQELQDKKQGLHACSCDGVGLGTAAAPIPSYLSTHGMSGDLRLRYELVLDAATWAVLDVGGSCCGVAWDPLRCQLCPGAMGLLLHARMASQQYTYRQSPSPVSTTPISEQPGHAVMHGLLPFLMADAAGCKPHTAEPLAAEPAVTARSGRNKCSRTGSVNAPLYVETGVLMQGKTGISCNNSEVQKVSRGNNSGYNSSSGSCSSRCYSSSGSSSRGSSRGLGSASGSGGSSRQVSRRQRV